MTGVQTCALPIYLEEPEDTGTTTNARLWDHYVDAAVFASWFPHFPAAATKGIDPALCWSEILGTICGSEACALSVAL